MRIDLYLTKKRKMTPIVKLYLKVFLLTGIPFATIMVFTKSFFKGGFNMLEFLALAFFFGFLMSLTIVSWHVNRLKKNGIKELTNENLSVNQKRIITSNLDQEQLINKLKCDSVLGRMKIIPTKSGIKLKAGTTFWSWGETMKIISNPIPQDDKYEYHITSKPKLKTTIIDYGKNLENVEKIQKVISA